MDMKDDNEMQKVLVQNLKRGKKIGLRGELIDTAIHLYILTQKVLCEMKSKVNNEEGSEDEIDAIFDINEDERPINVYDEAYDRYIGMKQEYLGVTTDIEINLATHPYSTNYLWISNMNLNYVKKNLFEAKLYLKDEESYSFRNIFERCNVLLSDAGRQSELSKTYNLAKNDSNLKLARIIFRYRLNLDELFNFRMER